MSFLRTLRVFFTASSGQQGLDAITEVRPDFVLTDEDRLFVRRICQLVEGMPLGIELAAAWTPLFSRAAAVVTDVGSPAAHASIIAREYGIPRVRLPSGEWEAAKGFAPTLGGAGLALVFGAMTGAAGLGTGRADQGRSVARLATEPLALSVVPVRSARVLGVVGVVVM